MSQTAQHPVQQAINEVLKGGTKKTESFNGVTIVTIEARISIKQSLEFSNYLSGIAMEKGRNSGTVKDKALNVISDWYEVEAGSISIDHVCGRSIHNPTDYYTIQWARDFAIHKPR